MDREILTFFIYDVRCAVVNAYLRLERSLIKWRRAAIETITADMLQTVWNELDYRVAVCRITNGAHIEHL